MNEIKTVRNHAKKSRWLLRKIYKVCLGISQVKPTLYDKSETHLFHRTLFCPPLVHSCIHSNKKSVWHIEGTQ